MLGKEARGFVGRRRAVAVVGLAVAGLAVGSASAQAKLVHPFLYSFDGSGSPAKSFNPQGVTVDNSSGSAGGDVYVSDASNRVVDRFKPSASSSPPVAYDCQITGAGSATTSSSECDSTDPGTPTGAFVSASAEGAVDGSTGDVWVADFPNHVVDEFDSGGKFLTQITVPNSGRPLAVALDAAGDVFVADLANRVVEEYSPSTSSWSTFATSTPSGPFGSLVGIAVDDDPSSPSFGDVYVVDSTNEVVDVYDSSGTFKRSITGTPSGSFGRAQRVAVDPTSGDVYVTDADVVHQFDATGGFLTDIPVPNGGVPFAVAIGAATGDVYVADASNGLVDVFGPAVVVPDVTSDQASSVTTNSATLNGTVNPDSVKLTDCHFDWGTTASYGQTAPCVPAAGAIPADSSDHQVSAGISGLTVGATYHFRLVAANANGQGTPGADRSVRIIGSFPPPPTFAACANDQLRYGYGADLPDCRAYEQASPVDKGGSDVIGGVNLVQASPNGNAVTFFDYLGLPGVFGSTSQFPSYVTSRGAAGWSTKNVMPPASASWSGTNPSVGAQYLGWSADLSRTLALAHTISPTQQHAVVLSDTENGTFQVVATGANEPHLAGFSADDSRVVFEDRAQLLPNAAAGFQDNVYEYDQTSGRLFLVGVLPDGSAPAAGSFTGSYEWYVGSGITSRGGAEAGMYTQSAISSDGSRVFFTDGGTGQLYVRENPTSPSAATVQVSASQKTNGTGPGGTDPNGPKPAAFRTATPDGSHVFFTSQEELTNNANTGSADQGDDLYEYDVATGALSDLTPDPGDSSGAGVQGVLGASSDGSHVYFVANGVLATNAGALGSHASPGNCRGLGGTTCNLYLWHDGTTSFIAQVSAQSLGKNGSSDAQDWEPAPGDEGAIGEENNARVTPSGQTLLFSSHQQLTSYDNAGVGEFYRYSAADGKLICVSCDPTGVTPTAAATLQSITGIIGVTTEAVMTRNLSDDGDRVFFESSDPLLSAATNGVQNVYEWEADGSGSCQSSAENGGCLYLLSTGTSPDPSYFGDASPSGDDAFLFTTQQLVGQDTDQLLDVYDARVEGGLASQNPVPQTSCSGEDCKPPAGAAPAAPTAATVTFSGPGDLTAATPAAKAAKATILSKIVRGTMFFVRVRVPAKGRITLTAAGAKTIRRSVNSPGTYRFKVMLTTKAKSTLARKHKLKLKVRVGYTPAGGSASIATVGLTVEPAPHSPSRQARRALGHNHGGTK